MRPKAIGLLFLMVLLPPVIAGAVSEQDFEVQTTENMINLCTVFPDDPLYHHAINFCHGYLVGAFHYYLYDHHKKAQQKAHDQAYEQGYEAGKKSQ